MSELLIPVSIGELIDKITILRIKKKKIKDDSKLANITHELIKLENIKYGLLLTKIDLLESELHEVNSKLWDVEENLRELEHRQIFNFEFIELARSVYKLNDFRSDLKKNINLICNSSIVEEKSYTKN